MQVRPLQAGDRDRLARFFARIPDADRTFFKEDVDAPGVADRWTASAATRRVVVADGEILGSLSVVQLTGWSSHVGELRLIVDPAHRGRGIGRMLARTAVLQALALGLGKVVVEVIAVQEETIGMFRELGFEPEALLADHVRDRDGVLRDLMVLAHSVQDQSSAMAMAGVADDTRS